MPVPTHLHEALRHDIEDHSLLLLMFFVAHGRARAARGVSFEQWLDEVESILAERTA